MGPVDSRRPTGLAVFLVIAGVVGLVSAFALTLDKIAVLEDPAASLGCNFSLLVQCGANLSSAQGAVLGFPNPLIGLAAFCAPIVVGTGLLAGARYARWFWLAFEFGIVLGLAFVCWLIGQSIFILGTLCPWCMLVWATVIPLFLAVTLYIVRAGILPLPSPVRRAVGALYQWVPLLTVLCYVAVAVIAQLRLDVLSRLT